MLWVEQLCAVVATGVRAAMIDAVFLHGTTFESLDMWSNWEFFVIGPPFAAHLRSLS